MCYNVKTIIKDNFYKYELWFKYRKKDGTFYASATATALAFGFPLFFTTCLAAGFLPSSISVF